jgi:hypothetical protein
MFHWPQPQQLCMREQSPCANQTTQSWIKLTAVVVQITSCKAALTLQALGLQTPVAMAPVEAALAWSQSASLSLWPRTVAASTATQGTTTL